MEKLSRNAPCRCGSGKKYKHCCLERDANERSQRRICAESHALDIQQILQDAVALHGQGRLAEALQTYQRILDVEPEHADALHLMGVVYQQQGDYTTAIRMIKLSVSLNAHNPYARNNLGVALKEIGDCKAAQEMLTQAIRLKPDYADAYINLGNILKDSGLYPEAVHAYQRATTLQPTLAEGWNNLALVHLKQFNLQDALSCAQTAVELSPQRGDLHNSLGNVYKSLGMRDVAIQSYRQALEMDSAQANARHFLDVLLSNTSEIPPGGYVASVFDDYADRFDEHLMETLHYGTPALLKRELTKHRDTTKQDWRVLDLGCGTGLAGMELSQYAYVMVGVDLSQRMLRKANERHIYHRLIHSDLMEAMILEPEMSFDTVVAADVFVYIGNVAAIFKEVNRLLTSNGIFAFSTEDMDASEILTHQTSGYCLRESGRYAHNTFYLSRLAGESRFRVVGQVPHIIRMENKKPIHGCLYILSKI